MATPELSEAERVAKIARFGFDKPETIDELAERISLRASHISDLAADLH